VKQLSAISFFLQDSSESTNLKKGWKASAPKN